MTEQTKALAPYDRFVALAKQDNVQERFRQIMDKRTPQFMASLVSIVAGNDALQKCNHASILTSAAKAAILDLPIEQSLGFAHIVPFKGEAVFVIGYKGYIQLAIRTGMYEAINAAEIYQGDQVKVDRLTGNVTLNGKRTGDEVIGYVGYFKLKNGFQKFVYMTVDEVHAHAKRFSKSYGNERSTWTTNFPAMAKKTVLRRALSVYGLLSIQMQDEDMAADTPGDERFATPDLVVPDFSAAIEGEMHDPEPEQPQPDLTDDGHPNETGAQAAVRLGVIDHINRAENVLKKKLPTCTLNDFDFIKAYEGWRAAELDGGAAAAKANAGEMPK